MPERPGRAGESEWRSPVEGAGSENMEPDRELHQESFELNGRIVEFFGVSHSKETLEKHYERLEESIKKAAIIVLEGAPAATGTYSNETVEFLKALAAANGQELSTEAAADILQRNEGLGFFHEMEKLAIKHDKPVATVDPMQSRSGPENYISFPQLRAKDQQVLAGKLAIMGVGTLGLIIPSILKMGEKKEEGKPRPGMGRRRFLQVLGGTAAAIAAGSEAGAVSRENQSGEQSPKPNPLRTLLYDSFDYRDVIIAEGLDRITKELETEGPVVVIYGEGHRDPVRKYAKAPGERQMKKLAYRPYKSVAEPKLRVFRFHQKQQYWQRLQESEL